MRNVYDFDKTIYKGDSSIDFYKFCLKRHPSIAKYWPAQIAAFVQYKTKKITKTQMKEIFYRYYQSIPDMDRELEAFWDSHIGNMKRWYYDQQQESDLIISASPEFMLKPACERIGIKYLLASPVDGKTGKYLGENCYHAEKVRRFREAYPGEEIRYFYSDSYSDSPLADISEKAFLVDGDVLKDW